MKRHICIFIFVIVSFAGRAQYNSDYVQYMFNGLLLNPAYAGSHEALNVTGLYRRQWAGFNGAPVTAAFTGHSALRNKRHSVGGVIVRDRFGLFSHTRAGAVYAFRVPFASGHLAIGAQAGVDAYSYNWNAVRTTDLNDPSFSGIPTRNIYPDVSAGIYYHSEKFYAGISNPRLLDTRSTYFNNWNMTAGCVLRLSDDVRVKPAALVRYVPSSPVNTNLSATIYYRDIAGAGVGCTFGNNVMLYADIRINEQLNAGYGYQRQLNNLNTYTGGSHEVMLRYLFRYRTHATSARYF